MSVSFLSNVVIREEREGDIAGIFHINNTAFPTPAEANLVNQLRDNGKFILSLVAEIDGELVGHVLLTEMEVLGNDGQAWTALGLGPVAIMPAFQNQSIGSKLMTHAIAACKKLNYPAILLLGHTAYYPRFGFMPASNHNIQSALLDGPNPAFMALELYEGSLAKIAGIAHYQPEFGNV